MNAHSSDLHQTACMYSQRNVLRIHLQKWRTKKLQVPVLLATHGTLRFFVKRFLVVIKQSSLLLQAVHTHADSHTDRAEEPVLRLQAS